MEALMRKHLFCSRLLRVCCLLAVLTGVLLVSGGGKCDDPYRINPNLVLLLRRDRHCLFNPVISPDGQTVYYLEDTTNRTLIEWGLNYLVGSLLAFNRADSSEHLLLSGAYRALAISEDGQRLALLHWGAPRDTTCLLVLDLATGDVDSVNIPHPGIEWDVWDLGFTASGQALVFNAWLSSSSGTHFYRKGLVGDTVLRLVQIVSWKTRGFDVFGTDSIYADSVVEGIRPAVNPQNNRWAVFASETGWFGNSWVLHDRWLDTISPLGRETRPYYSDIIEWPYWTPDGRDLIFTAGAGQGNQRRLELWLLKDAMPESLLVW